MALSRVPSHQFTVDSNITIPTGKKLNAIDTAGIYAPGQILQVQQTVITYPITFTTTLADVMSVTITPKFSTSKVLVEWDTVWGRGVDDYGAFYLYKNESKVYGATGDASYQDYQRATGSIMNRGSGQDQYVTQAISGKYLDTPNTTSLLTYKLKAYCTYGSNIYLNRAEFVGDTGYQIRTFSSFTLTEIAQ